MNKNIYNVEFLDGRGYVLARIQQEAGYAEEATRRALYRLEDLAGMEIDDAVNALHGYKEIRATFFKKVGKKNV